MKKIFIALILIFSLYFSWPLFKVGYIPTHDGEFSIMRIWQYSKMMERGYVYPRWAPDLNSGFGVPLFTFYYPLPYFVGSLFHFAGFSLVDSFKLTLGLSYLSAIAFCFLWLKKLFSFDSAALGTLIFLSVPYWFVNIYVRGSVGEVMALASFMAALICIEYDKRKFFVLSIALLILSHNISAFILLPLCIGYVFFRRKKMFKEVVWGLALSAFFWVPAIAEQKFVLGLSNFNFRDHFPSLAQLIMPSWGTGFSRPGWPADEMSQQLGFALVALLVMRPRVLLLVLPLIFLMFEQSIPIWEKVSPLRFIQYPWRFLIVFIPLAGLLAGHLASKQKFITIGICAVSIWFAIFYSRPVLYSVRDDRYYLSRREFTDGTTTVGNSFSTVWLPWQKERPGQAFEKGPNETMIANISYYPGWTALVDGKNVAVREINGRIGFTMTESSQHFELRFAETPLRKASDLISIVGLFWLIGSGILNLQHERSHRRHPTGKRT